MNKVLIALLIVLSTVLVVGGIFTYSLVSKEKDPTTSYDPGDEIITNLSDNKSLIKIDAMLEVRNKKVIKSLEKDNYKIRDTIISVIRKKSPSELNSEEGIDNLKKDIIDSLNQLYESEKFVNVYFEEIIVQ